MENIMTDELMKALAEAKTDEERKQILECSKTALTDEELEQVSGGDSPQNQYNTPQVIA